MTSARTSAREDVCVYGFGATGKCVVDQLLDGGSHNLRLIVDRGKCGSTYRGIPIVSLPQIKDQCDPSKTNCLIGLHNHYVDTGKLYEELAAAGFKNIYSIGNCSTIGIHVRLPNGYWLDPDFRLEDHRQELQDVSRLLADAESRHILQQIVAYRDSGDLRQCPVPSSLDEYMPHDLPRYSDPLRLIDCGAFTGVAIEKFISAGHVLESLVAFEPDLSNYEKLTKKDFGATRSLCLPLGVWSSGAQLRFSDQGTMGSAISADGHTVIQCVAIDDALKNFFPNLIKLDVEGAEVEALRGAQATIESQRPNLCVSVYHKPGHLFEIPLLIKAWNPDYQFHLRVHEFNTFGVVLYCLNPKLVQT